VDDPRDVRDAPRIYTVLRIGTRSTQSILWRAAPRDLALQNRRTCKTPMPGVFRLPSAVDAWDAGNAVAGEEILGREGLFDGRAYAASCPKDGTTVPCTSSPAILSRKGPGLGALRRTGEPSWLARTTSIPSPSRSKLRESSPGFGQPSTRHFSLSRRSSRACASRRVDHRCRHDRPTVELGDVIGLTDNSSAATDLHAASSNSAVGRIAMPSSMRVAASIWASGGA